MEWLVPGERVCRVTEAIEVREAIEKFYSAILGRTAESEPGEGGGGRDGKAQLCVHEPTLALIRATI